MATCSVAPAPHIQISTHLGDDRIIGSHATPATNRTPYNWPYSTGDDDEGAHLRLLVVGQCFCTGWCGIITSFKTARDCCASSSRPAASTPPHILVSLTVACQSVRSSETARNGPSHTAHHTYTGHRIVTLDHDHRRRCQQQRVQQRRWLVALSLHASHASLFDLIRSVCDKELKLKWTLASTRKKHFLTNRSRIQA